MFNLDDLQKCIQLTGFIGSFDVGNDGYLIIKNANDQFLMKLTNNEHNLVNVISRTTIQIIYTAYNLIIFF